MNDTMSDHEFVIELRRGLMTIMRAIIKRYNLSWESFMPRVVAEVPRSTLSRAVDMDDE